MKAVLISIRPKWCELIASGEKTIEVRKTRPKLDMPFKCYIYCTRSGVARGAFRKQGKVIGEFVCEQIKDYGIVRPETYGEYAGTGLSAAEMAAYSAGRPVYGWHISNLRIYDTPRELSEFTGLRETKFGAEPVTIRRPPQSFCYVEDTK